MPSPFPGMDPWLEGPHWMSVHTQLTSEIARQLSPKLLPKYVALTTERQVVDDEEEESIAIRTSNLYPDVAVIERGGDAPSSSVGVLAAPLTLLNPMPHRVPHVSIEIRDVEHMRLVAGIEVLSPTNKRGRGYREYLAKRAKILRGTAHLLEIDLLREGRRLPLRGGLPQCDYFVFLSRGERRPEAQTWPIPLRDPLPIVPVPLLPEDNDVPLDLQLAFSTIYDLLGYRYVVNYRNPPRSPLGDIDMEWALERLRAAGIVN